MATKTFESIGLHNIDKATLMGTIGSDDAVRLIQHLASALASGGDIEVRLDLAPDYFDQPNSTLNMAVGNAALGASMTVTSGLVIADLSE